MWPFNRNSSPPPQSNWEIAGFYVGQDVLFCGQPGKILALLDGDDSDFGPFPFDEMYLVYKDNNGQVHNKTLNVREAEICISFPNKGEHL